MLCEEVDPIDETHKVYKYEVPVCHKQSNQGGKFVLNDWVKYSRHSATNQGGNSIHHPHNHHNYSIHQRSQKRSKLLTSPLKSLTVDYGNNNKSVLEYSNNGRNNNLPMTNIQKLFFKNKKKIQTQPAQNKDQIEKITKINLDLNKGIQQNCKINPQKGLTVSLSPYKKMKLKTQRSYRNEDNNLSLTINTDPLKKTALKTSSKNQQEQHINDNNNKDLARITLATQMIKLKKIRLLKDNGQKSKYQLKNIVFPSIGKIPGVMNDYHQAKSNQGYSRNKTGGIFYK